MVYGMGSNYWGSLGLGGNDHRSEPQVIPELCHQNIQRFLTGHQLVLAINDRNCIYCWCQPLGSHLSALMKCEKPVKVFQMDFMGFIDRENNGLFRNHEKICEISCGMYHILALTSDGDVYGWGDNRSAQLGCGDSSVIQYEPKKLHFKNNPSNDSPIDWIDRFDRLCPIGKGSFGEVWKVKDKSDGREYADESDSRVVIKTLAKLTAELDNSLKVNSQYVVNCLGSWVDSTTYYIQMELCSDSLQNILTLKPQVFGRQPGEPMNSIEFYISCHIFKEILECV
ncbi:unnamed protein product, partial [Oppiella nova]